MEVALHNAGGAAPQDAGGNTAPGVRGAAAGHNADHAAPPVTADAERGLRTDEETAAEMAAEIAAMTADAPIHAEATAPPPVDPDKVPGSEVDRSPVTEAGVRGAGAGLSAVHAAPRPGIAPLRLPTGSAQAGETAVT